MLALEAKPLQQGRRPYETMDKQLNVTYSSSSWLANECCFEDPFFGEVMLILSCLSLSLSVGLCFSVGLGFVSKSCASVSGSIFAFFLLKEPWKTAFSKASSLFSMATVLAVGAGGP